MGRKGKQKYYVVGSSSNLSGSPKFFKIVVNPQDDKLRIPTGFIERYGQNLSDMVTLKAPNGSLKQVELTELDGETWLYNGWGEFKDYYSIGFGHLLVFEYDGKSHFDVFIFDMTAMEIEYPLDVASEDDLVLPGTEVNDSESDDDSAVILKGVHTTLKRNYGKAVDNCSRGATIRDKETCVSYRRAKAFVSDNLFCICLIQPSFVANGSASIPVAFARKHLPEQRNMLTLHIQKKGSWTVGCSVMSGEAKMSVGWGKFVKENALKVGDTCVFEVNKRKKLLWNVTIFREPITVVIESESEDFARVKKGVYRSLKGKRRRDYGKERHQERTITDKENCATYRKAKALLFDNPICIRIMQPSYVSPAFSLSIPLSFAKKHLPAKRNKLMLQVQDVTWTARCFLGLCNAKLSVGKGFVKDNALKVGDTCVFEVNKFKKCLWNVTIIRG